MKTQHIQTLTLSFQSHAQQSDAGVDFWLARDLQALLGYAEWRNFELVITKAKIACEGSAHEVKHHFVDVNKMIELPKGEVEKCQTSCLRATLVT